MKQKPRFLAGLPLLVAIGVALGTWVVAGANTPATVRAQSGIAREAGTADAGAAAEHGQPEAEHKIPKRAEKPTDKFPITNSMIATWVVAALIIVSARRATRQMKKVPDGRQNFWEWIVENLQVFLEGILGRDLVPKTFWFFATIFLFILTTNWFGLLPGFGTIGWGHQTSEGFVVTNPLLRGGNADLNMTAAMSVIFMLCWAYWSLKFAGIKGSFLHIFGPKGDVTGFIRYLMIGVFFLVGFLEVVSIAFRPVSLSFRLYGNIFAGENLLEAMGKVVEHPAWAKSLFRVLLPVPFYFMELLVGFLQAMVFMLLTAVFTSLQCAHEEGEHGKAETAH
jgi:F-type H+-transporting ATPase subunit a